MANVINATSTGNGGLITTGDDSGVLNIQTNETTAISIDASQSVDFTNNIDAPNTFGFKNRLINGAGLIFQRGASVTTDSAYFADRWYIAKVSAGTFTATQSSTAATGFTTSLSATVNTADASVASSDEFSIRQHIEGYNITDLSWGTANAKSVTVSFWVRSSVTGTYPVAIRSADSGITYVTTYTINAADTFEYKSATIPGPTTGSFGSTNNIGFTVIFGLGGGTDFQGTANTWNSGNKWFTSACTQWISTSGATWYATGIQLEKGTQATSFDFRSYGTELALCQRYFVLTNPDNTSGANGCGGLLGSALNTTSAGVGYKFPVTMRAAPTITRGGASNTWWVSGSGSGTGTGTTSSFTTTRDAVYTEVASLSNGSISIGMPCAYNGQLSISAEL